MIKDDIYIDSNPDSENYENIFHKLRNRIIPVISKKYK